MKFYIIYYGRIFTIFGINCHTFYLINGITKFKKLE